MTGAGFGFRARRRQAQADLVDEPAATQPAADDEVGQLDEIDAGGSLLPRRVARLVPPGPLRRAAEVATVVAALVASAAAVDAVLTRPEIIVGNPVAAPAPASTPTPFDRVLGLVRAKQLTGNIRQSSEPPPCATVAPGHSPEQAVLTVLRQELLLAPTAVETARTLDQYTGLCSLEMRLEGPGGVHLVVLISSPPGRPGLLTLDAVEVGLENIGAQSVEYVLEAEHTGWQILIGAVGPPNALPRTADLARAAGEPQMQW